MNLPYPVGYALSLSIIRGRGDVVTRFILLLSADAYAMQLCKQGLGGDYDKGDAWIYLDGSFVFRKDKKIQKTIPHHHAREFDEATEASLARLGLSRLLPGLRVAQLNDPATLVGPDIVLDFDDHKAVLIRADKKARRMIGERVQHGYTPRPPQEGDDDPERHR